MSTDTKKLPYGTSCMRLSDFAEGQHVVFLSRFIWLCMGKDVGEIVKITKRTLHVRVTRAGLTKTVPCYADDVMHTRRKLTGLPKKELTR